MLLMRYQPWHVMQRFHRQIDQLLGDSSAVPTTGDSDGAVTWVPSVDVHEEADKFVVRADLPGVEPKGINITAENGVLTVRGERHAERRSEQAGTVRLERAEGTFQRRFTLPDNVQTDNISARHTNGVLEVTIPKVAAPAPRRVEIQTQ